MSVITNKSALRTPSSERDINIIRPLLAWEVVLDG